jgi:mannose-6-phosphate isomerase-like protein (cupin superfamily)
MAQPDALPHKRLRRQTRRHAGEFHWHHHDKEDEFFYVVDGCFLINLEEEGRSVELLPRQGFAVPRGVVHRTRAPERTVILMFEGAGIVPTGDGPSDGAID